MGLFGKEKSGTPIETRAGTADLAKLFQNMVNRQSDPFGRMTSEAWINMLGFDPSMAGLDEAQQAALIDPRNLTKGLFAAMAPIEKRQTEQQVAGLRDLFGSLGGRFSSNIAEGESNLRSSIGEQNNLNRENALLTAGAQRNNALLGLLSAITGARSEAFNESFAPFQLAAQFLQPGAPIQTEGILPGLISLAGNLAAMSFLNRSENTPHPIGQTGSMAGGFGGSPPPGSFAFRG